MPLARMLLPLGLAAAAAVGLVSSPPAGQAPATHAVLAVHLVDPVREGPAPAVAPTALAPAAAPLAAPPAAPPATAPPPTAQAAQPTTYGCAAALAYLAGHAAPGFRFECPGPALGHQAMTCVRVAGVCPGEELISIAVPCWNAYANEASNSWVLTGQRPGRIDPYGHC